MPALREISGATRMASLDAVRGFALLGIVVVHTIEQYLASPPPASQTGMSGSLLDNVVLAADALLFVGKFFAMFSLLFGLSFAIQMDRAAARGQAFGARFAWRLTVLLLIGMAHHLVYRGDILTIYAALGFVLLLCYRLSDRWLLASAVAILLGGPRVLLGAWVGITGAAPSLSPGADAELQQYWNTLATGSAAEIAWINLTEGISPKLMFQFGWIGRGYQTLGLFLLGLYIGRRGWHRNLELGRTALVRLTWWSVAAAVAIVAVVGVAYFAASAAGLVPAEGAAPSDAAPPVWMLVAGFGLYDLFNLAVMGAMLGGFLLLYFGRRTGRPLRVFAPVGQTALTTYVAQSVIGAFLFYGWGLGLLGEIGATARLGLALVVFAGQVAFSAAWMRSFRYGPLEWVWRSATFLRVQPLARSREAALPAA